MSKEALIRALIALEEAQATAFDLRDKMYPIGIEVQRSDGLNRGVVVRDSACPAHSIPVLFSNGNVWWKPIQDWNPKNKEGA